jgi:N utilization substance protein B
MENPVRRRTKWRPSSLSVSASPGDGLRPNVLEAEDAGALAHDTVERLDAIDPLIAETAQRWRPERMAVLDRLILRMAVCELLRDRGTPPAVVINEALELARTFSTEEAVKFVNGVLDAIRKKLDVER